MEYVFYKLQTETSPERVCASLLEKIFESGLNALVYVTPAERIIKLSSTLWSFKQISFLPHSYAENTNLAHLQPIWLTDKIENPNNSKVLIILELDETVLDNPKIKQLSFSKVISLLNYENNKIKEIANSFCTNHGNEHQTIMWTQQKNGDWQKG